MDGGGGDVKSRVERDGETERKRPGGTRRAGRNRERKLCVPVGRRRRSRGK